MLTIHFSFSIPFNRSIDPVLESPEVDEGPDKTSQDSKANSDTVPIAKTSRKRTISKTFEENTSWDWLLVHKRIYKYTFISVFLLQYRFIYSDTFFNLKRSLFEMLKFKNKDNRKHKLCLLLNQNCNSILKLTKHMNEITLHHGKNRNGTKMDINASIYSFFWRFPDYCSRLYIDQYWWFTTLE